MCILESYATTAWCSLIFGLLALETIMRIIIKRQHPPKTAPVTIPAIFLDLTHSGVTQGGFLAMGTATYP